MIVQTKVRHRRTAIAALVSVAMLWAAGCSSFRPAPLDSVPFRDRVETQEQDGLTVSATVLSRDETKHVFGVDLYDEGIQPVWVRIENSRPMPFWFMLHGVDPNYFSAHEAAYKSRFFLRGFTNARMDEHFESLGIDPIVPALGSTEGFVFSNVKLGTKEVRVQLLTQHDVERFHFYITVPGFVADYDAVDLGELLASLEPVQVSTEDELVAQLEGLPCCTTRENGSGKGDPLNLVIITPPQGLRAFVRAGWDETELLTFSSAWKTFKAFFGGEYKYSPMSALYFDGRPQTIGLQKARDTIHERNHLRLWLTGWKYGDDHVLVGTITRDIGVYFTTRAWNLTTHAIDPMVDEARNYLVEDLLTTESIRAYAAIPGVGAADKADPHRNLMMAPWWTDGRRAVLQLVPAGERTTLESVNYFSFHAPLAQILELEGQDLKGTGIVPPPDPATDGGTTE